MTIKAMKTLFSASRLIGDLFIADLFIQPQSVQQIRVSNNHPPSSVLPHVGEPSAVIHTKSREWRDRLRLQQGPVQQQNAIVICMRLKCTIASQKNS